MQAVVQTYGWSTEQQGEVWRRWRAGESLRRVARDMGVPIQHVRRYLARTGGVQRRPPVRSARHLCAVEREEISRGLAAGDSCRVIAQRLGRPHTTVAREVARNGGRGAYRARDADAAADARAHRPKPGKLAAAPRLRAEVERRLEEEWSPEQISRRLPLDHPDDPAMRVSHETIYLGLFVPARAGLRRGLTRRLRTGRVMRYPKATRQPSGRGQIRDMVSIRDRPATRGRPRPTTGWWPGTGRVTW